MKALISRFVTKYGMWLWASVVLACSIWTVAEFVNTKDLEARADRARLQAILMQHRLVDDEIVRHQKEIERLQLVKLGLDPAR